MLRGAAFMERLLAKSTSRQSQCVILVFIVNLLFVHFGAV